MTARITFSDGTSASVTRPAFLAGKSALASFEAHSTNGTKVVVKGYSRQEVERLSDLVNAIAAGAIQGFKASQGIP